MFNKAEKGDFIQMTDSDFTNGYGKGHVMKVLDSYENSVRLDGGLAYHHEYLVVAKEDGSRGSISDGYHSFDELYFHRMMLFSIICNTYKDSSWKSWLHSDGTMYEDYFIVGVTTPEGDYSYHYHKDHWDEFDVKEIESAPEWDGHKPEDIGRLKSLLSK